MKLKGDEISKAVKDGIVSALVYYESAKLGADAKVGTVLVDQDTNRKYIVTAVSEARYKNDIGHYVVNHGIEKLEVKPL